MADTALRGAFEFLEKVGLFDVVLPFMLVFTIVFAILEKTKVFGTEEIDGKKYTKKNLNAIAAFVIAFLVVASSELVEVITKVSSNVVILLLLAILFLMLVGSFFKEGEPVHLQGGWNVLFMIIMFVGIVLIFLDALGWLEDTWEFLGGSAQGEGIGAIILIVIIVLFMVFIVREPAKPTAKS
jgi:hypothetical membrane protein